MRAEFLLTTEIRRKIKSNRWSYEVQYNQVCDQDEIVRLALKIQLLFPGLVQGPLGSEWIYIASSYISIRCVVMKFDDALPIIEYLSARGWRAISSSDEIGYRQHLFMRDSKTIYLECYPDIEGGSKCRRVKTDKRMPGFPVYEYICEPEEEALDVPLPA